MEGGTFHTPKLAAVMRERIVESRLHLDYPDRIAPSLLPIHERVRDELVHRIGAPNYALVDPATGEFLYSIFGVPGGDTNALGETFFKMFSDLPAKREKA